MIYSNDIINITNLNSFLKFGYFLHYDDNDNNFNYNNINKKYYENHCYTELIDIGSEIFKQAIQSQFNFSKQHLVPISGGIDSRAILVGLLEYTEANNISTFTYGSPNTYDYDIGTFIAKKLGTRHISFDLTKKKYTQNELEEYSQKMNYQTILFHNMPVKEISENYPGFHLWSGFMGDPLAGSKLLKIPSLSIGEAINMYINKNTFVKSIQLNKGNNYKTLIDISSIENNKLTLDEQLDFNNRQKKYIAPHVLIKGFKYNTPFLDQDWFDFMLSVDNKYRFGQKLYNDILISSFPKAFSYKVKNNRGLPLSSSKTLVIIKSIYDRIVNKINWKKNAYLNYVEYNDAIRNNNNIKKIVYNNIMDLNNRQIIDWVNIPDIWDSHIYKKNNYADALITLASLEIHLKAGKII